MFCTQCGSKNPGNANFCNKCGQSVLNSSKNTPKSFEETNKKPAPQPNRQEKVTMAWADGKLSREQGLTDQDCPYADEELVNAWREGYRTEPTNINETDAFTTQGLEKTSVPKVNQSIKSEIASQKKFTPALGELPVIEGDRAAYYKSSINVDWGKAHLTTHRIVFCGESGNFFKLMISPALAIMTSSALPKIHFQILLDDIEKIEYIPKGLKSGFFISSKQGKVHRIALTKNKEWEIGLAKYMK